MLIPIIQIDSNEARKLDVSIALQKIYYQPAGYQRNAKKLLEVSLNDGYDFTIDEVNNWMKDRLYTRYISLVLDIFLVQVLLLLLLLMKYTRQIFSICLMIK